MVIRHAIIGIVFWIAAITVSASILRSELETQSSSVSELTCDVGRWVTSQRDEWQAESAAELEIARNDSIFIEADDGTFRQVGYVLDVDGTTTKKPVRTDQVRIYLYDEVSDQFPEGFRLEYHTTSLSLTSVVKMMLPKERQEEIAERIARDWQRHEREVMAQFQPVMRESFRRATAVVEEDLPVILKSHREEFQQLGNRYEDEIVRAEILPLVRDEVLPIIEEEAQPMLSELGRSLWKRVSVWSFTWRYLYDKSPLPAKNAVKSELDRFIDEEATPEFEARSEEFVEVTERILRRVFENPRVREVLRENLKKVAEDPELHRLVWTVVREALLENERLRQELNDYWSSDEARLALRIASDRLEPTVRSIGDMIFGTRETGITPEFARVLRAQILSKDRRWFIVVPDSGQSDDSESSTLKITVAEESMLYPLRFSSEEQSPLTLAK